jgi:acetyl esterase/lipase
LGGSDILEMRASRAAHLQSLHKHTPIPGPLPDVIERDQFISTRDGTTIRVRIYSPKDIPKGGSPLIVMYHEGGWCFGDLSDEELNCRNFCKNLGAICVNIEYRSSRLHN